MLCSGAEQIGKEGMILIQNKPIIRRTEMIRCALCHDAPCDKACPSLKPSNLLRSIWFENEQSAVSLLPDDNPCAACSGMCEESCVRPGEVKIKDLVGQLYTRVKPETETEMPEDERREPDRL